LDFCIFILKEFGVIAIGQMIRKLIFLAKSQKRHFLVNSLAQE
jgi:hypothetical protein